MTHIADLLDLAVLDEMIEGGFVRRQTDATGTLAILNYTEQAVYTRTWNGVTTQCRGLIYRLADGEVLARPFAKFFNYGEHAADTLALGAPVEVTDKADGSLGILYTDAEGRAAIATRGSFLSEQAQRATEIYRERYLGGYVGTRERMAGWTFLFEIVYPANRIVLDYGDMEDLILLGAVHIETGRTIGPVEAAQLSDWPGHVVETFDYRTLADALAAEPRPNAEGLVVRYLHSGLRIKIKQDDYVALHRIVTGLTARRIWERLAVWSTLDVHPDMPLRQIAQGLHMDVKDVQGIVDAGRDWQDVIKRTAPEEFTDWITATVEDLDGAASEIAKEVLGIAKAEAASGRTRKEIAQRIARHPHRGMIFGALDRKPTITQMWASVRPAAERPYRVHGEDVA